jgi:hypothetical protein
MNIQLKIVHHPFSSELTQVGTQLSCEPEKQKFPVSFFFFYQKEIHYKKISSSLKTLQETKIINTAKQIVRKDNQEINRNFNHYKTNDNFKQ